MDNKIPAYNNSVVHINTIGNSAWKLPICHFKFKVKEHLENAKRDTLIAPNLINLMV